MYPSPPLSTNTLWTLCASVSVGAVELCPSDGLSRTLPFRVARTLPVTKKNNFKSVTSNVFSTGQIRSSGQSGFLLTRYRDEELDSVTVSVETQLGLCHGAVRDEAAAALLGAVVAVHVDHTPGGCRRHLIGWREQSEQKSNGKIHRQTRTSCRNKSQTNFLHAVDFMKHNKRWHAKHLTVKNPLWE